MTFDSLRIKLGRDAWTQLFNSLISRLDHQLCALSMAQPLEARLRRGVHHSHRQGDQAQRWKVLLLHARVRGVAEPECRRLAHIQNQGAYLFYQRRGIVGWNWRDIYRWEIIMPHPNLIICQLIWSFSPNFNHLIPNLIICHLIWALLSFISIHIISFQFMSIHFDSF